MKALTAPAIVAMTVLAACSRQPAAPPGKIKPVAETGAVCPEVADLDRSAAAVQIEKAIGSRTYYIRFSNTGRQEIPNGNLRDHEWIHCDDNADFNDPAMWSLTDSGRQYFARIKPCFGKDLCAYTKPPLTARDFTITEMGAAGDATRTVKFEAQLPMDLTVLHALDFDHPQCQPPRLLGTAEFHLDADGWRVDRVMTKTEGKTPYQHIEGGGKWTKSAP